MFRTAGLVALFAALLGAAGVSAAPARTPEHLAVMSGEPSGTPELSEGLDASQFGQPSYMEGLSEITAKHQQLIARIRDEFGTDPDLLDLGTMPGADSVVLYWSGATDDGRIAQIQALADQVAVNLVVAPRLVSSAQLDAARSLVEANVKSYRAGGIVLSAYGGFAADFDGFKVFVDPNQSSIKDLGQIQKILEGDVGIPVLAVSGGAHVFSGKYDDTPPFNGGGLMMAQVSGNTYICTTGFGVVYGASVYRYLSARHCDKPLYSTESGNQSLGAIQLSGTGVNGAAVFSQQGFHWVFDGSNVGNPTSTRNVTQKDPGLSTVGTTVCQEGGNLGQKCGTIAQVALNFDDGVGGGTPIRVNYVTSPTSSIIAGAGDSGSSVISQHTLQRAWAVGILQGAIGNSGDLTGTACGFRWSGPTLVCSNNFVFTNVDYALSGFTGYGIRYG